MYTKGVPAIEEVKFSVTSQRGCFGGCSYCAITYHQGRSIQKRSKESILREVKIFIKDKDFKGYVHDVGGPTANFRNVNIKRKMECAQKRIVLVTSHVLIWKFLTRNILICSRNCESWKGLKKCLSEVE